MNNLRDTKQNAINLNGISFSNNNSIILIAGPCQIESKDHAFFVCSEIEKITKSLNLKFVYKSSFDKANRTSINSKRGVGLEKGLDILNEVKKKFNCPVLTDVHEPWQCSEVAKVIDIIQIPAMLCRQTDLLTAAAKTKKIVNIKKGQFLSPWEMTNAISKVISCGNNRILVTERGTMFGYNNLVTDFRSLYILKSFGFPVVFDATHSVQQPGNLKNSSGGQKEFIPLLAKASVTSGISSIFIETHENPDEAPSDGACMVALSNLKSLLKEIKLFDDLTKKNL